MKTRTLTGCVLAVLALTLPLAPAASARAGSCVIDSYHPTSVIVGASPVTTSFGISTHGCSGGLDYWTLEDYSPGGFVASDGATQNTFDPNLQSNDNAGLSSVTASAYAKTNFSETKRTFVNSFDLKRRVAVQGGTLNATPEPVRRGGTETIVARIVTVDWDAYPLAYIPFAGHTIAVQFRPETSSAYKTVKNVKADGDGYVRTTAIQSVSGFWRVAYGGTTTFGPMTALGDHVLVS